MVQEIGAEQIATVLDISIPFQFTVRALMLKMSYIVRLEEGVHFFLILEVILCSNCGAVECLSRLSHAQSWKWICLRNVDFVFIGWTMEDIIKAVLKFIWNRCELWRYSGLVISIVIDFGYVLVFFYSAVYNI